MDNIVFWIGVKNKDPHYRNKHGDFKYLDISEECWRLWCDKNNVKFIPYLIDDYNPKDKRTTVTWQRWFDLEKVITREVNNLGFIWCVDGSSLIKSETPAPWDFHKLDMSRVYGFRSLENLRWISGIKKYESLFEGLQMDLKRYFTAGNMVITPNHFSFLKKLEKFYDSRLEDILTLQTKVVKRGTDQSGYNAFVQSEGVEIDLETLDPRYMLTHLNRFEWLSHNWQLKDKTPFYLKYGWLWMFSGFPNRGMRYEMMENTWNLIKESYA